MPEVLLVCYPVCDIRVSLTAPLPITAGATVPADRVTLAPGGLATTVFVAARLGVDVIHLGVVGHDDAGDLLVRGYEQEGVSVAGLERRADFATQAVVVLADPQQHAYASVLQGRFADEVKALALLEKCRTLVISGYMLGEPETLRLAVAARTLRRTVVLDPGPLEHSPEVRRRALALTDVLVLNEAEAYVWSGEGSVEAAAAALASALPPHGLVVVKTGARGCYAHAASDGGRWYAGFEVPLVDAVGAGDAFLAGFLRGHLEGWDLATSLTLANAAGAATAAKAGAGPNAATLADLQAVLRTGGCQPLATRLNG